MVNSIVSYSRGQSAGVSNSWTWNFDPSLLPSPSPAAIAKSFRQGRQEDAHEFLRYFVDGLQKSCLQKTPPNLDPHSKATTVVHKIFGGYHRSQGEV